jgi:hypothetical protein
MTFAWPMGPTGPTTSPTSLFKIKKLDGRYDGHRWFKYRVEMGFYIGRANVLTEVRNWLWNTWGPSVEIHLYAAVDENLSNNHWAWDTRNKNFYMYLASDKELTLFQLKWS